MNIHKLSAADIPFGLRLTAQNHWNQLECDWRRQLDLEPEGCFLAERAGLPIGTACCCVFDDIAWINLVLVDKAQRGRGVGTALLRHVVQYVEARGVVASIRLDATPLGQPIYEKFGFLGDFTLTRFEGTLPAAFQEAPGVEAMTRADLAAVCRLDEAVTKTRREKLLRLLIEAYPEAARKFAPDGEMEGYSLARPGAHAWQLGPIQGSPQAGRVLVLDAARRFAGQPVYLDVPADHAEAVALAQALGLTPQRPFLRMSRGRRGRENLALLWSTFGPEKG
jgi:GNAT superfamily N-acetyltransferase